MVFEILLLSLPILYSWYWSGDLFFNIGDAHMTNKFIVIFQRIVSKFSTALHVLLKVSIMKHAINAISAIFQNTENAVPKLLHAGNNGVFPKWFSLNSSTVVKRNFYYYLWIDIHWHIGNTPGNHSFISPWFIEFR